MTQISDKRFRHAAVAVFAVCVAVVSFLNVEWFVNASPEQVRADFDLHYMGAVVEQHGSYTDDAAVRELSAKYQRPYQAPGVFGAPPLIAFVYMPFTTLSIGTAEMVWNIAIIVLVIFAIRSAGGNAWPYYLLAFVATNSALNAVRLGNASLITFVLVAFAYANLRDKPWRPREFPTWWNADIAAGMLLGLATAFKIYPGFLLIALVACRRWQALRWMLGTAVVVSLAAIIPLGWHDSAPAFRRLIDVGTDHQVWLDNDSISGIATYMMKSFTVPSIINIVGLVLAALVLLRRSPERAHITLALSASLMLLVQSISWGHYFTLSLLLLMAIVELTKSLALRATSVVIYLIAGTSAVQWPNEAIPPGIFKTTGLIALLACFFIAERQSRVQGTIEPADVTQPAD